MEDATFSILFNVLWVVFLVATVRRCEQRRNVISSPWENDDRA